MKKGTQKAEGRMTSASVLVGTSRCDVTAAFSGGTREPTIQFTPQVAALTGLADGHQAHRPYQPPVGRVTPCAPSSHWNQRKRNKMNSRFTNRVSRTADPELARQERSNPLAWLIFHTIALWSAASYWLRFKRICAWHQPAPRRMGGNPFAPRATHGLCADCFARVSAEIISHGETNHRVSVTEVWQPGGPSLLAPPARNCAVPARLQRPSAGDPDTTRPAILRGKKVS